MSKLKDLGKTVVGKYFDDGGMKTLDEAHKRLITKCFDEGHKWGEWEDVKYTSGSCRTCSVCKLYTNIDREKNTKSYAIGSTWESADVAIPFINSLAYKSRH